MELVYWDFAAAWIVRTVTGRGSGELRAARHRMQSDPNYDVTKHLKALALAERYVEGCH
jgi:hypothetical protein